MTRGEDDDGFPTRRGVLATTAGVGLASTSGCIRRLRSLMNRETGQQVSVRIKTVPADKDPVAVTIARNLADNLETAGIESRVVLMPADELLRDVLINHDFDLYVATHAGASDPDFLRPLTHSRFAAETGWQNPFGFADLTVDDLLEEQRWSQGRSRRLTVEELQRELVRQQPFTTVAVPDDVWAVREDRFVGWREFGLASPLNYVALRPTGSEAAARRPGAETPARQDELRVVTTDSRVTENSNPIAVEFRNRGTFMGLLYDSLAREYDGSYNPWLAEEWTWEETGDDALDVTVRLREDLTWHDGSDLTASDVAFTYRFLSDTSLGNQESSVPAPQYRAQTSLVESAEALDDRRVRLRVTASHEVAESVLTVPILPEREWRPMSKEADIAGVEVAEGTTEALVWDNPEPVGSGPLQLERRIAGENVSFEPFEDHFLERGDTAPNERFGRIAFTSLDVRVAPSSTAMVELVAADDADATSSSLAADDVPRIGRNSDLELVVEQSRSYYHVGFNADVSPMSNTRFRRTVARLVDKEHIVRTVMGGYASPVASPLDGTEWLPSDLEWGESAPRLSFLGEDGQPDEEAAREAFENAGFRYDEDGRLIAR
ncbi:ABC transporter substrate-binding protein [Halobacteriales archaeon QS_1_68_20]|nr:MAG: ABC transporter substrate-binding protein [Halobacteriales archaeon QS_1_68_20]